MSALRTPRSLVLRAIIYVLSYVAVLHISAMSTEPVATASEPGLNVIPAILTVPSPTIIVPVIAHVITHKTVAIIGIRTILAWCAIEVDGIPVLGELVADLFPEECLASLICLRTK